ncbi:hypothetical protein F4823DRAFT_330375 [Ustulina deusta]|nr:hypothetical protein F4823DRAFT_330375 [Ustulina deusta]
MSSFKPPTLPSTSATRAPPPRKLRDSCCNCAKSKLRCSKEKPTCARCVKQGKACSYVPSKRAGRNQTTRLERSGSESAKSTIPVRPTIASPEIIMSPATTLPGAIQVPMPQYSPIFRGTFPSLVSFAEESVMPSPSTPRFFDMEGVSMHRSMFDSIDNTDHSETETAMAHSFIASNPHYSIFPTAKSNPALPRDTTSDPSMIQTATHSSISPASDAEPDHPPTPTELPLYSQCSCLSRAFELLQELSLKPSGGTRSISTPDQVKRHPNGQEKANHRGAEGNKKHVEEILNMVECTCSEDPYLLSLMSLLAFKIMGRYKIAAREFENDGSTSDHHLRHFVAKRPTIEEYSYSGDNGKIRIAAQCFLEELLLVQQLVGLLSLRLRGLGAGISREQHATSSIYATSYVPVANSKAFLETTGGIGSLPLPTSLLYQLEVDLRRQVHALSIEVFGDG